MRIAVPSDVSFSARCSVAGEAIQDVLGHSDANPIPNIYTKVGSETARLDLVKFRNSTTVIGVPAVGDLATVTIPVDGIMIKPVNLQGLGHTHSSPSAAPHGRQSFRTAA
jgi:hypothetical protein